MIADSFITFSVLWLKRDGLPGLDVFPPWRCKNVIIMSTSSCPHYHVHISLNWIISQNDSQKNKKGTAGFTLILMTSISYQDVHSLDQDEVRIFIVGHQCLQKNRKQICFTSRFTQILITSRCPPTWSGWGGGRAIGVGRRLWSKGLFSWSVLLYSDAHANVFVIFVQRIIFMVGIAPIQMEAYIYLSYFPNDY